MVVAGEVSGDMHAARLVKAIRAKHPDAACFGIGGDDMADQGVDLLYHVSNMAVMGISEVLRRFGFFRRVFYACLTQARERRPDAVILVDYPGFNLRLARRLHRMGIPVVYYICPQVWAWRRSRIPKMAKVVDRLITIFPFEAEHFAGSGLQADFVGHPLVDEARLVRSGPRVELPWKGTPRIALLPGSRVHEIRRILPVMWSAATLVQERHTGASFIIPTPSEAIASVVRETLAPLENGPDHIDVVAGNTRQVLLQATAAMVASGTATVEAALMDCPMIVVYRVAPLTYLLGRMLVRVDHIGMVNIVAGERLCPEFMQHEATPDRLAGAMEPLLNRTPERDAMLQGLERVRRVLGRGNVEARAARLVLDTLRPARLGGNTN